LLEEEEEEQPRPPRRKKIGKSTIMPDKTFAPIDEDSMIGEVKDLPERGQGHEQMAQSSLSDIDRHASYPPRMDFPETDDGHVTKAQDGPRKMAAVKNGGKKKSVQFIEDVTEIEEDDENAAPQGMSMEDILGDGGGAGVARSKEAQAKSSNLKNNAEKLMAERENIVKKEDNHKKVRVMN